MNKLPSPVRPLCLLLSLSLSNIYNANCQVARLDSIRYDELAIAGIKSGSSSKNLTGAIGMPDSVLVKINEFEDSEYFHYAYGNSNFYIVNKKFVGFNLKDSVFLFDYCQIRVGDPAEKLKIAFPNSLMITDED